jgi:HAE1 family hydrophobic/amphiphilic exporter-1
MTAFAFILGCVPLWVATGAGGVARQILGTVVIGGMLAATTIALFLVPVTFSMAERVSGLLSKGHSGSVDQHCSETDAVPTDLAVKNGSAMVGVPIVKNGAASKDSPAVKDGKA